MSKYLRGRDMLIDGILHISPTLKMKENLNFVESKMKKINIK